MSCGTFHSLLLSSDGYIYAFGRNEFGEIGNKKEENQLSPYKMNRETKISHRNGLHAMIFHWLCHKMEFIIIRINVKKRLFEHQNQPILKTQFRFYHEINM
jgi:alpha-tubulin suppressor-like RCC1 family protein